MTFISILNTLVATQRTLAMIQNTLAHSNLLAFTRITIVSVIKYSFVISLAFASTQITLSIKQNTLLPPLMLTCLTVIMFASVQKTPVTPEFT